MPKKKRPHGHYCKICGQYKANEKFSGKGHAAHICKACSRLPAAEKAEAMTMNKLLGLSMRKLNESEIKWLENRTHDKNPEVAGLSAGKREQSPCTTLIRKSRNGQFP